MFKHKLYLIENKTPMHVGSGDTNFDLVDRQIQRDTLTSYPTIHASSLKGALKEYCTFRHDKKESEKFLSHVFGDEDNAGKMRFTQAHLLSVPMRSNIEPYYHTTSPKALQELLETIDTNKLSNFDMEYAEKHFQKYAEYSVCPKDICFDLDVFREKNILLLGSGKTMSQYEEIIHQSIKKKKMIVISLNFIPDGIDIDYAFFSNEKRFAEFKDNKQLNDRLIVSSNINTSQPHSCISIKKMSDGVVKTSNACLMMLNLFVRSSYTQVFLAGIDGFDSNRIDNYSYRQYGQLINKKELEGRNSHLIESFKKFKDVIICTSITPSNIIN